MRRIVALLALGHLLLAADAGAGTIAGTVRAQGKEGAEQDVASGRYDSRKYRFVERIDYAELRDFVVYIDQPLSSAPPPAPQPSAVVVQEDATFKPHVLPVAVGSTVRWVNKDEILHNVFSISETKEFDLGLYGRDLAKAVTFDKVGRVDVFCSIHKDMHCIVLVLANPFFAVTGADGRYTIPNVPPGTYRLKAWHERMPSQVKEIAVPATGKVTADFLLGIADLPQY